jgi:hypothetical protein
MAADSKNTGGDKPKPQPEKKREKPKPPPPVKFIKGSAPKKRPLR